MPRTSKGHIVLLTGATGSIGRHILYHLAVSPSVSHIYALVRAPTHAGAVSRLPQALRAARLSLPPEAWTKITAIPSSLSDAQLSLPGDLYTTLHQQVTTIIHGAWIVNFNLPLSAFESHIAATASLLNFAITSPTSPKPTFNFISSVASVFRAPKGPILEKRHPISWAGRIGYGYSKWVAEALCDAASHSTNGQVDVRVLRTGQICGDRRDGVWNFKEVFPMTVQSALSVGALPLTREINYWLPMDVAGDGIVQLALREREKTAEARVWHVSNAKGMSWDEEFLPALRRHGLQFEAVERERWCEILAAYPDPVRNPTWRLLEFYRGRYEKGGVDEENFWLDTRESGRCCSALRDGVEVDEELIGKFLHYWMSLPRWRSLIDESGQEIVRSHL
ncbi:hypothetical protein CAC42_1505 [Sphaceloma murrayae]|uniref:Thioester reductase (TE) domain-containing protein n=1 Tax=Sphaceloma murrayae TaxID=2082308 RepID=A0A2K1R2Y3_9PEZI|nr:hypothetical protein CAC42_1505 [Sphaceloma murrayae]